MNIRVELPTPEHFFNFKALAALPMQSSQPEKKEKKNTIAQQGMRIVIRWPQISVQMCGQYYIQNLKCGRIYIVMTVIDLFFMITLYHTKIIVCILEHLATSSKDKI